MIKNEEGYADPTYDGAYKIIRQEEKRKQDEIEIMTRGLSGAEAYYMGNIIKYLYRYPKKGTLLSDLAKAEEYTKFLRELFMEDGGKA